LGSRQFSEFETTLVYKASSRTARATQKSCLQNKTKTIKTREREERRGGGERRGEGRGREGKGEGIFQLSRMHMADSQQAYD